MASQSRGTHRQSRVPDGDEVGSPEWSEWKWITEKNYWMREQKLKNGKTRYQYGKSKTNQPRTTPEAPYNNQRSDLLPTDLSVIDYSTGGNYRLDQGFPASSNENTAASKWINSPNYGMPSSQYPDNSSFDGAPPPARPGLYQSSPPYGSVYDRGQNLHADSAANSFPPSTTHRHPSGTIIGDETQSQSEFDPIIPSSSPSDTAMQSRNDKNLVIEGLARLNLKDAPGEILGDTVSSFNTPSYPDPRSIVHTKEYPNVQQGFQQYQKQIPSSYINQKTDSYPREYAENEASKPKRNQQEQDRPPKSRSSISIVTANPSTKEDPLFKEYHIHSSEAFRKGRVFKMLWSEPHGVTGDNNGGNDDSVTAGTDELYIRDAKYGEKVYSTIRRFVIVKARKGHCVCVPILTYGGQGLTKAGAKAEYHAIMYSTSKAPKLLKDEVLSKKPIRVVIGKEKEKLKVESRVNYSKTYTVEHNVKVCFIGEIHRDFEGIFFTDFKRIFDEDG